MPDQAPRPPRTVKCDRHGEKPWGGHLICDACGRRYTTHDATLPTHAPARCACRKPLMPEADREHFTARIICAACFAVPAKS